MLLDEELKREEEAKERLCSELNMLIQQSAELQVHAGWGWWARVPLPGCSQAAMSAIPFKFPVPRIVRPLAAGALACSRLIKVCF